MSLPYFCWKFLSKDGAECKNIIQMPVLLVCSDGSSPENSSPSRAQALNIKPGPSRAWALQKYFEPGPSPSRARALIPQYPFSFDIQFAKFFQRNLVYTKIIKRLKNLYRFGRLIQMSDSMKLKFYPPKIHILIFLMANEFTFFILKGPSQAPWL